MDQPMAFCTDPYIRTATHGLLTTAHSIGLTLPVRAFDERAGIRDTRSNSLRKSPNTYSIARGRLSPATFVVNRSACEPYQAGVPD